MNWKHRLIISFLSVWMIVGMFCAAVTAAETWRKLSHPEHVICKCDCGRTP